MLKNEKNILNIRHQNELATLADNNSQLQERIVQSEASWKESGEESNAKIQTLSSLLDVSKEECANQTKLHMEILSKYQHTVEANQNEEDSLRSIADLLKTQNEELQSRLDQCIGIESGKQETEKKLANALQEVRELKATAEDIVQRHERGELRQQEQLLVRSVHENAQAAQLDELVEKTNEISMVMHNLL